MNPLHKKLIQELKKYAGNGTQHSSSDSYFSSGHFYYSISVPLKRSIAKEFVKEHKNISVEDLVYLLDSLFDGNSYEEKTIAGIVLGYLPKQRKEIAPEKLDEWLNFLVGWAEIDTLCQSTYTPAEILDKWKVWEKLLRQFATDSNISKRRASLVLLTGAVSNSDDKKLAKLAFENIEKLQYEKDILITKAVSWLLRSLIKYHKRDVAKFIKAHENTLPKIALRETKNKLLTGKK